MDHGWMGEVVSFTCPAALGWVLDGPWGVSGGSWGWGWGSMENQPKIRLLLNQGFPSPVYVILVKFGTFGILF